MASDLRLAFVVVPSDDPVASEQFYSRLTGAKFERSLWSEEGFNTSLAGVDFDIEKRHNPKESTTPYYQVDHLDDVLRDAIDAGAKVVFGPADMHLPEREFAALQRKVSDTGKADKIAQLGRVAVIVDPGGAQVGFTELGRHVAEGQVSEYQQTVLKDNPELRSQVAES